MLPGCMSAWKKPSRNTCVKKISTPSRASFGISTPAARSVSTWLIGTPTMRSITSTRGRGKLPVHLRHEQQIEPGEIAAQLAAVRGLAHQVEFVVQVFVEFRDHLARLQALVRRPRDVPPRSAMSRSSARSESITGSMPGRNTFTATSLPACTPGFDLREVHLRDRRARHRHALEVVEQHVDRRAQRFLDDRDRHRRIERRHLILKLREFVGDIDRQADRGAWTAPART